MGGNIGAAFHVPVYGEDLHREEIFGNGTQRFQPRFLRNLPQGDRQQVPFPVGMAAGPAPAVINVVVHHQHPTAGMVHHPGRSGKVRGFVLPGENIRLSKVLQQQRAVAGLLLVAGAIGQKLAFQRQGHGGSLLGTVCGRVGEARRAGRLRRPTRPWAAGSGGSRSALRALAPCSCFDYSTGGAHKKSPRAGAF